MFHRSTASVPLALAWALAGIGMLGLSATASADAVYAEIANFSCFYGECQPGIPTAQPIEMSPGTFLGTLNFGAVYTLTASGQFGVVTSLPGAGPYYVGTPLNASDGAFYIPVGATVFKLGANLNYVEGVGIPVPVYSTTLVESPAQLLYGAEAPVNTSSAVYSLDMATSTATTIATTPEKLGIGTLLESSTGHLFALTVPFSGADTTSSLLEFTASGRYRTLATFGKSSPFLIEASDGNFYGCGGKVLYRLTPAGAYSVIYTFPGGAMGSGAYGCGLQASDGKLYGTTYDGGAYGYGTVYSATLDGVVATVYSFTGAEQEQRSSQYAPNLVQGSDGKLYGQTTGPYANSPGTNTGGTTFALDLGLPKPVPTLMRASPMRVAPGASLLLTGQNLLGTTAVAIDGVPASFVQKSAQYVQVTMPTNVRSGTVTLTTPNGSATSAFAVRAGT